MDGRPVIFRPTKTDKFATPKDLKGIYLAEITSEGNVFVAVVGQRGIYRFDPQQNVLDSSFPSSSVVGLGCLLDFLSVLP